MDKWLQNDTVAKLVAFLLAVMLWLVVSDETNQFQDHDTNNIVSNVVLDAYYDEDKFEIRGLPETITLHAQGPDPSIKRVEASRLQAYVDLRNKEAGRHKNVPIQVKTKGLPGVEVSPQPRSVDVVLEEKRSETFPVEVEIIGRPEAKYHIGEPVVDPGRVRLFGSKSTLKKVRSVKALVHAEGATETISRSVSLQIYGEDGLMSGVEADPQVIDVEVPIVRTGKEVPLQWNQITEPKKGYAVKNVKLSTNKVMVYGPKDYIKELKNYPLPKLDLSNATSDRTFKLPLSLSGEAVKVTPERVNVQVEIVEGTKKTMKDVPIEIQGKKEGFDVQVVSPDRFDLTLFGAPSILKNVEKENVKGSIDLADLPPGEHHVSVKVDLPKYIRVVDEEDLTVTVRIQKK
ncbi:CdaR family protein [Melghirimyces algeriensis]|uniref:YbbR domain-containing protein n=1 Tax=Melghirimyces algeriensis TaxID=910412 RepID=A0A521EV89_9BACL|nr:CdaR family protein [Melghirimyces algeriensis]SMO87868.1 YbbR domain-containing protein [Melghirimyces algeriensis]